MYFTEENAVFSSSCQEWLTEGNSPMVPFLRELDGFYPILGGPPGYPLLLFPKEFDPMIARGKGIVVQRDIDIV